MACAIFVCVKTLLLFDEFLVASFPRSYYDEVIKETAVFLFDRGPGVSGLGKQLVPAGFPPGWKITVSHDMADGMRCA